MAHVIVGVSGGVDSALSAALLMEQGHRVEGLFMFNWAEDEDAYCTAAEDFEVARQVCADLGIPLHRADFSRQYQQRVFAHFLAEYRAGRTPSPDLLCNREIKFKEFLNYATSLGCDYVATGHYADLRRDAQGTHLIQAADTNKDQTYFLAAVEPGSFDKVLFPLGRHTKQEVRQMAQTRGLVNYQRKDSTGICFIGERPMREFLSRYMEAQGGDIVDDHNHVLGSHPGLCFFTIGQRKGLGIGGQAHASDAPWYVYAKEQDAQRLRVTQDANHPSLRRCQTRVAEPQWLFTPDNPRHWRGKARIRHRQALQDCELRFTDGIFTLEFDEAQWAIAPGQYAVFYQGDECLGCAVIQD